MSKKVLITGGSGMIGSYLTTFLLEKGYRVAHLSRRKKNQLGIPTFEWDIEAGIIEDGAFDGVSTIIHLAGSSVGKRWTDANKKVILSSRVESTNLLFEALKSHPHEVTSFISASGINIYPDDQGDRLFDEAGPNGNNFLAQVTRQWEQSIQKIPAIGIRTCILRSGMVLSKKDSALDKLAFPVKYGLGAVLGTGKQYISWIHIFDLCNIILFCINNNSINGIFNAVSPSPVTNKVFTKEIARVLKMPILLPKVPPLLLKIILGEMSSIVLKGVNVSCEKIQKIGFQFKFEHLHQSLLNLFEE